MDLEVVGRHALFFDDDASASFVNSRDALVEWNSLFIDRYDVRHLLAGPLPPITRRRHLTRSSSSPPPQPDAALEFELDQERMEYNLQQLHISETRLAVCINDAASDTGNDPEQADAGGYHTVGFSYGNPDEFTELKNNDTEPVFQPAFPVPESLIQNLPPTEKLHQIIARTATFVSKHDEEKKAAGGIDQTGGALSLLGSVYGSGEDEDGIIEDAPELGKLKSGRSC
ncbi:hypothetical protein GBA52_014177 [Prunus armeniaca]|nr:hypothetical protein GBA52_014177 [Prunus armeniaca]